MVHASAIRAANRVFDVVVVRGRQIHLISPISATTCPLHGLHATTLAPTLLPGIPGILATTPAQTLLLGLFTMTPAPIHISGLLAMIPAPILIPGLFMMMPAPIIFHGLVAMTPAPILPP